MKSERTSTAKWVMILSIILLLGIFACTAFVMMRAGAVASGVLAAISAAAVVFLCVKFRDRYKKEISGEKGIFCFLVIISMAVLLWIGRSISWNRWYSDSYRGIVMFLLVAMLSVFFITTMMVCGGEKRLHRIYFPIALVMGIVFMMMLPAFQAPDEVVHAGTAYRLSNSIIGVENVDDLNYLKMREADAAYPKLTRDVTREQREKVWDHLFEKTENTKIVKVNFPSLNTFPVQYLVPALGISLGRAVGASGATVFFLGRLFNLLFFVCLITLAIKITPVGKNVMFMVALLPITIQQGMSFSYDVFLIVCAFLYIAEVFHWSEGRLSLKTWSEWGHALLLVCSFVCLMMIKQHAYTPMALLLLMILVPHGKVDPQKLLKLVVGLIVIVAVLICCAFVWCHFHPLAEPTNILSYNGKPSYTIQYILNHPGDSISVFGNTLIDRTAFYYMSGIGSQLGWLDVPTNMITTIAFLPLLLAAPNMEGEEVKMRITGKRKALYLLISLGCFGFTLFGMWTGWTPLGNITVEGVQGRYLLPFMPLLLLAFTTGKIKIDQSLSEVVPSVVILLDIIAITSLM
jgi:uncharacterized membrane protein